MIKHVYLLMAYSKVDEQSNVIGVFRTKEKAEEQKKLYEELHGDNTDYYVDERPVI